MSNEALAVMNTIKSPEVLKELLKQDESYFDGLLEFLDNVEKVKQELGV